MICKMCGSNNPEDSKFCNYCGTEIANPAAQPHPSNFNVQQDSRIISEIRPDIHKLNPGQQNPNQGPYGQPYPPYGQPQMPPQPNLYIGPDGRPIKTYMTPAVIALVLAVLSFCCLILWKPILMLMPIGLAIAAVVFASKADTSLKLGNAAAGMDHAKKAKAFMIAAFCSTVIFMMAAVVSSVIDTISYLQNASQIPLEELIKPENKELLDKLLKELMKK